LAFFFARSRVFAGIPADSADFLLRPSRLHRAAVRSLRAVFLSGLAPCRRAEVRKGRRRLPSISTSYVLTDQAVG